MEFSNHSSSDNGSEYKRLIWQELPSIVFWLAASLLPTCFLVYRLGS